MGHEPTATSGLTAAQQAWAQVLGRLRREMNRADFETWVRDVRVLAYDGQVLVLGVANAYARDWLTDRLRTPVERQLRGLLGGPVQVVFRVVDERTPYGTTVPQAPPTSPPPAAAPQPLPIAVAQLHRRLRDAFLQNHRVIYLPGYFLRWVPLLGSRAAWLYLALRQTYFLHDSHPHGPSTRLAPGAAVEVTRETLGRWAHLTPRTINNILNRGQLTPLVQVVRDRHLNAHRQAPNRYAFTADMLLTPSDRQRVLAFLRRHGWPAQPIAALARALEAAPHGLIPTPQTFASQPPHEPQADLGLPLSLRDLLAAELPPNHLAPAAMTQLLGMAELLETTLIETWGKLFVPWYFVQHHLPRLGHTFAWLYLTARYLAERQGKPARHGFRLLETTTEVAAAWVGLSKARYVRDLIPPAPLDAPADLESAPPDHFLRRLPARSATLTLAVQMGEVLAPADHRAYRLALSALARCIERRDFAPLRALQQAFTTGDLDTAQAIVRRLTGANGEDEQAVARAAEGLAVLSTDLPEFSPEPHATSPQSGQNLPADMPKVSPGEAKNFPPKDQNLPSDAPDLSPGEAKNFPHFNPSQPLTQPQEKNRAVNPPAPQEKAAASTTTGVGGASWTWERLLPHLHLAPTVAQRLQAHAQPWMLVAWLLYAHTPQAKGLTHPLGFAVHKTLQGVAPGSPFDDLARAGPAHLQALLARHWTYGGASARTLDDRWAALEEMSSQALQALMGYLAPDEDFV